MKKFEHLSIIEISIIYNPSLTRENIHQNDSVVDNKVAETYSKALLILCTDEGI